MKHLSHSFYPILRDENYLRLCTFSHTLLRNTFMLIHLKYYGFAQFKGSWERSFSHTKTCRRSLKALNLAGRSMLTYMLEAEKDPGPPKTIYCLVGLVWNSSKSLHPSSSFSCKTSCTSCWFSSPSLLEPAVPCTVITTELRAEVSPPSFLPVLPAC